MKEPALAELQRWSEEVARDPGAPSFVPLARAYRRQGRGEAAVRVCLRGLKRNPAHVDAHALLALLYLETGQREKAGDEWATVLRLDPDNFEAHRGLGFLEFERGRLAEARAHLEKAAAARPQDTAVREALDLLDAHAADGVGGGPTAPPEPARTSSEAEPTEPEPRASSREESGERSPGRVFAPLLGDTPFMAAVIMDRQGLVLASTFAGDGDNRTEALGATIGTTIDEANRTVAHLDMGAWSGMLLETETAAIHLTPLDEELVVLFAAERDAPAGWVVRTADRAVELARGYLEEGL